MSEEEAFQRDYRSAPDMATLEQYAAVPVEEFGAALLRGMGWKDGEAIGKRRGQKEVQARIPERRPALLGIGAKSEAAAGIELGAWGKGEKGFKGRRKEKAGYTPVVLRNKKTGEQLTEEELRNKMEEQKMIDAEREREKSERRARSRSRESDYRGLGKESWSRRRDEEEAYRREKERRNKDHRRSRDGDRVQDSDRKRDRDYKNQRHQSSRRDRNSSVDSRHRSCRHDDRYNRKDKERQRHETEDRNDRGSSRREHRDRDRDNHYGRDRRR